MSTTQTSTRTYRKTKTGEWVAYGPADSMRPGDIVTVTKKSGATKSERITRVGRTFEVDGVEMAYGYLDQDYREEMADAAADRRDGRMMAAYRQADRMEARSLRSMGII